MDKIGLFLKRVILNIPIGILGIVLFYGLIGMCFWSHLTFVDDPVAVIRKAAIEMPWWGWVQFFLVFQFEGEVFRGIWKHITKPSIDVMKEWR